MISMIESIKELHLRKHLIPIAALLIFIIGIMGIAAADAAVVSETEVIVTSPATVGIVTLIDKNGDTITTGMIMPAAAAEPLTLTYNPAEHQLSSISIMGAGYFPASVSAQNPPAGCKLAVEFILSGEDENAGYGKVTVIAPETPKDTAAKTPAPLTTLLAGLLAAGIIIEKRKP